VATKIKAVKTKSSSQGELKRLSAKVARLEKQYTRVSLEKNFLERALGDLNFHNNAHDGIVYTDAENRIVYANPYFLKMMGFKKKSELLDKPFPDYMWSNEGEAQRLHRPEEQLEEDERVGVLGRELRHPHPQRAEQLARVRPRRKVPPG